MPWGPWRKRPNDAASGRPAKSARSRRFETSPPHTAELRMGTDPAGHKRAIHPISVQVVLVLGVSAALPGNAQRLTDLSDVFDAIALAKALGSGGDADRDIDEFSGGVGDERDGLGVHCFSAVEGVHLADRGCRSARATRMLVALHHPLASVVAGCGGVNSRVTGPGVRTHASMMAGVQMLLAGLGVRGGCVSHRSRQPWIRR